MKQVYLITNEGRAALYGIGTYIEQITNCILQSNSNMKMSLIYLNSSQDEFKIENTSNIRIFYIPEMTFTNYDIEQENIRYYRCVFYLLAPYINEDEDNVFHFNYMHNAPLISFLREKYINCKTVYTVHYLMSYFVLKGDITLFYKSFYSSREKNSLILEKERDIFNSVDKIICLSERTYSILEKYYKIDLKYLVLIPNGLKDQYISLTEQQKIEKKQKLSFKSEDRLILYVGRLDEMKGIESLIEAFKKVSDILQNSYLIIIGDGNYDEFFRLVNGKWSRIIFTGRLSREQVYEFYQVADIGIIPSVHEQCSYVGIEMLMHGLPLIGTTAIDKMLDKENCLPLIEKDGEMGLSSEDLAYRIITLLTKDDLNTMKKRSRECFLNHYEFKKMAKNTLSCYLSL